MARSPPAHRPDWLVVVGDVNSTLACALTGVKLGIPTVHLEAGLRSRDRTMPEEINRIATDAVADVLWTPSPDADANLLAEGVPAERITRVGNIMLDSFEMKRAGDRGGRRAGEPRLQRPRLLRRDPAPAVQCRRSGAARRAGRLPGASPGAAAGRLPGPPAHRGAARGESASTPRLAGAGVRLVEPMPYVRFMSLVAGARAVVTDSGGIQEETTYLGIPCFTLRDTTERPITVERGHQPARHRRDGGRDARATP